MTAKTMAEVLEEHEMDFTYDGKQTGCSCGHWQARGPVSAHADHAAHQAAALSAAGFGLVADAKAEWGVRWEAAGPFPEEVHAKPSKLSAETSLANSAFPGVVVRRTVTEWEAAL